MTTRITTRAATAAVVAALTLPGAAAAKAGDRAFAQTYPRASALCAKIAAGGGPNRLQPFKSQVLAACNGLQTGFTAAQSAVQAAQTAFLTGRADDRAAIRAVCTPPVADRQLCRRTRRAERGAIAALRHQHRAAVRLYFTAIEANRRAFWTTIHALPGAALIPADPTIPPQSS